MIKEVTTKVLTCDICQRDVSKFAEKHTAERGFEIPGGGSYGVGLLPFTFGEMRAHVCQTCFDLAILEIADRLKAKIESRN